MKLFLIFTMAVVYGCGPAWDARKEMADEYSNQPASSESSGPGGMSIVIFDVGEGDSALIISPEGEAALIDTGLFGTKKNIPEDIDLKYLFISHSDNDHDGDLPSFDIMPEPHKAGDSFRLGEGVDIYILAKDCEYADGERVDCEASDDNAHSAAMLVTYGSFSYLTTGDLPGGGGSPPYQTIDMETYLGGLAGDVDVLHVGHHGSNTSTNQAFLELVKPEAAVISVGDGNDYWHPHPSTIERLLANGIAVHQTERGWLKENFLDDVDVAGGDVTIESNGTSYDMY